MKYAIRRYDGELFPERFDTVAEAQRGLDFKLGNGAGYGLAWIVQLEERGEA